MIKICFILGSHWNYMKGGSEYQVKLLIDYLQEYKKCKLFYVYAGNEYAKTDIDGVEVYILPRRKVLLKFGKVFFWDYLKMIRILNHIQPDVIYQRVALAYTGIAAHYAKNNCKMIWHIASENDVKPFQFKLNRFILFNYLDRKFIEYGIRNTDHIIGQAEYQDKLLRENYGRKCDLIVPNFHPIPKHEIRKEEPIKVVWIANLKKLKQPEIFIRLAEEFSSCRNVRFIMIGRPGSRRWRTKLEREISKLSNLEYLREKPIDEVNKILCSSHIFVNTSRYEGFPNTFIQAWMRKVPVVSLNVDPDGILMREGIGSRSGNIENMVKDLKNLISNKNLREVMGEKAQKYALENHTIEKNVRKIVRLFYE